MARLVPLSNGLCCSCTALVEHSTFHDNIHIAAQSSHLATLTLATCLSDNILGKCICAIRTDAMTINPRRNEYMQVSSIKETIWGDLSAVLKPLRILESSA